MCVTRSGGVPTVDVVVCVHNALSFVSKCVESLLSYTPEAGTIILIDDGSDCLTNEYLRRVVEVNPVCSLKVNTHALGYTRAANEGIKGSMADFVVLVNSDAIVTDGWLARMLRCAYSDMSVGVVSPISNAASWQSIPRVFDDCGDYAVNTLPTGMSLWKFSNEVRMRSMKLYPKVAFVNGFCLGIKREAIISVGYFDEITFPSGFGEEIDFCFRAADAGYSSAVVDDVFLFHAKSQSYGHARRRLLARRGRLELERKHGLVRVREAYASMRHHPVLRKIRSELAPLYVASDTR